MKAIAIINPISGRRDMRPLLERLAQQLKTGGCDLEIKPTRGPGDAARLSAAAPDDCRAVIAAGGDGTCREVAEGLIGRDLPMVAAPGGTENLVAKHFGYRARAAALAATILHGQPTPCDVGIANDRKFLLLLGVGFDAQAVHCLASARRGHITHLSWVGPIAHTLMTHRFPPVRVVADGNCLHEGGGLVFVGVIPRYAVGLRILPHAVCDDGLLDVCILPCRSRFQLIGYALRTALRRLDRHPNVIYKRCRTVRVESASGCDVPAQLDGDPAGRLPVDCSIIPRAVRFLVPPSQH